MILHETDRHEWPVIFHLYAKVWLAGSGSFWEITECDDRAYDTGYFIWCDVEDHWSRNHIAIDKQSVEVEGGARFYGYILIPGIGEVRVYTYYYYLLMYYDI